MIIIIGIVVVFGAVIGGFLMEHGNLRVLIQPAELVTIGGAALGTMLIANPLHILKKIISGLTRAFGGSKYSKQRYLESLKMMFELFSRARRDGLMALETCSDNPDQSPIFSKHPRFLKDHHALAFVCDSIRMASSGGIEPFDADQMIENDMDVHHHEAALPMGALSTVADSLPGLGIVAAVLGVVITMGSLGGSPEEIGKKVVAALVGTFLGILMCYGLVGPVAASMAKGVDDEHAYCQFLRVMIVAFMKGTAPSMAVEIGRRAIPGHVRPSFQDAEKFIKDKSDAPAAAQTLHRVGHLLMSAKPPIIVIKKKGGHGGHHGGAWKVAYADFVTDMMAFFIVWWLLNSSKQVQEAVGGYFKDPAGTSKKVGSDMVGSGENFVVSKDNMAQLKEELQKAIREVPNFDKLKSHIDMTVTNEGLRIELTESASGTFHDPGSAKLNSDGEGLLMPLAKELGKLPNKIAVEGHTDAKACAPNSNYTNWELPADRANSARRMMQENGLGESQVSQVRGFADQRLRKPAEPLVPANRRVSLIVQYLEKPVGPPEVPTNGWRSRAGR